MTDSKPFSTLLRELSRAASPAPWSILGGPKDYAVYIDGAMNIGYDGELIRPDAALIVALRNRADRIADVVEAVAKYREATNKWRSVPPGVSLVEWVAARSVRATARDALFAALDALEGAE